MTTLELEHRLRNFLQLVLQLEAGAPPLKRLWLLCASEHANVRDSRAPELESARLEPARQLLLQFHAFGHAQRDARARGRVRVRAWLGSISVRMHRQLDLAAC